MRRGLAAGNWKMNGIGATLSEAQALMASHQNPGCDVLLFPPATLLSRMAHVTADSAVAVGAQDCHPADKGAHTGDLSASMLVDAGAVSVILGHSERRADHGEDDALVRAKTEAAQAAGLAPIVCVGETLDDRDAGRTLDVVGAQVAGSVPDNVDGSTFVIAYEPVWAIGTGRTPTLEQIGEVHAFLRRVLVDRFGAATGNAIRLLYGGSVKPSNASEIFAVQDVDGALVGGASLKASDFGAIIAALSAARD